MSCRLFRDNDTEENMKYPNALTGIKRIYLSEIIALIASVIMVICSVILMVCYEEPELIVEAEISSIALLAVLGIFVFSYILQIAGIVRATKDEPAFRVSLIAIIAALVITVLQCIFYESNHIITFVLEIAGDVAEFFLVHYIIHGIMHLSDHLGRPDITKKGKNIFRVIYIAIGFEIVVRIFEMIFGKEVGEQLSMPFGIAANILKVVEYILFLSYIGKSNKLLKEN